jgi:hypothetical protein
MNERDLIWVRPSDLYWASDAELHLLWEKRERLLPRTRRALEAIFLDNGPRHTLTTPSHSHFSVLPSQTEPFSEGKETGQSPVTNPLAQLQPLVTETRKR